VPRPGEEANQGARQREHKIQREGKTDINVNYLQSDTVLPMQWARILPAAAPVQRPEVGAVVKRKWVACIIARKGVLRKGALEQVVSPASTGSLPRGRLSLLIARPSSPTKQRSSESESDQTPVAESIR